jgi:hypothetical protein
MTWVIEYSAPPPHWIEAGEKPGSLFRVTFDLHHARRFTNRQDTNDEILRLGLASRWIAREIEDSE